MTPKINADDPLVKHVTKRSRQAVVVMTLERDLQTELRKLERRYQRATTRLSYARPDQAIAEQIGRCRFRVPSDIELVPHRRTKAVEQDCALTTMDNFEAASDHAVDRQFFVKRRIPEMCR